CYLKGRLRIVSGETNGIWLILLGLFGFGTLAILTKENSVLLPLFMLALEFTLFQKEFPWSSWKKLSPRTKGIMVSISTIILAAAFIWFLHYVQPSYALRNFTMVERLLTESRVLFFYLFLILIPRIDQFALYHDDIPLSTSIITPWTTLPAVLGIVALLAVAIAYRKKYPLLSLGILWFFIGHALESTFLGLELIHEHRNYLASLGVWMVVLHLILQVQQLGAKKLWMVLPLFAVVFAAVTAMRSSQWSNIYALAYYEAAHHPNSADAQNFLGVALGINRHYDAALESFRRASELRPTEALYLINMTVVAARIGIPLSQKEQTDTIQSIIANPSSGSTFSALLNISSCLQDTCSSLQPTIIDWTNQLIEKNQNKGDKSLYYYILGIALSGQGRLDEAITALQHSYQMDKKYLHPLIKVIKIYISQNDARKAEEFLAELRAASQGNLHPRNTEITQLAEEINRLKKGEKISP
ncbi:MAG: tetratricopeptide repeat protein, partial [Nitrospinota bacterium]